MTTDEMKNLMNKFYSLLSEEKHVNVEAEREKMLDFIENSRDNILEGEQLKKFNLFLMRFLRLCSDNDEIEGKYQINRLLNYAIFNMYLSDELYEKNKEEIISLMKMCDGLHVLYEEDLISEWSFQFDIVINKNKEY